MGHPMPATTQCSRCSRTLPVRSCVQVGDAYLPMFVVLTDVGTVEEALAQATCQMCLKNGGPSERDLYKILLGLGCESDTPVASSLGGILPRRGRSTTPSLSGVSIVEGWNRDPTRPSLAGVTIERPRRPRQDWRPSASEPRLPSVLRERKRDIEPEPKVEHLTGGLADSAANKAALETAMQAAKEREQAKRRVRLCKFGGFKGGLTRLLARIRETAALTDVQDEVAQFRAKLIVAAGFDPKSRGKKRLMEHLGTSQGELEHLCYFLYKPRERRHIPNPEVISVDAFEGDRRPESWDQDGGMRPDVYVVQVEIVRTKPKKAKKEKGGGEGEEEGRLPTIPNDPLSTGDGPKIVYPQGGKFGPKYTVENSRHPARSDDKIDQICQNLSTEFLRWLGQHREKFGITTELASLQDDFGELIEVFFIFLKLDREAQASTEILDPVAEPTTLSPDLPATT